MFALHNLKAISQCLFVRREVTARGFWTLSHLKRAATATRTVQETTNVVHLTAVPFVSPLPSRSQACVPVGTGVQDNVLSTALMTATVQEVKNAAATVADTSASYLIQWSVAAVPSLIQPICVLSFATMTASVPGNRSAAEQHADTPAASRADWPMGQEGGMRWLASSQFKQRTVHGLNMVPYNGRTQ